VFRLFRKERKSEAATGGANPPNVATDWIASVLLRGNTRPYDNLSAVDAYTSSKPRITFDGIMMERPLTSYVAEDTYPIPATADREGYYGSRHYDYWLSGLKDYLGIKQAAHKCGVLLTEGSRVLDFGCASGRVLRHFLCHEEGLDLWGVDINLRHVEWIRRFLPPSVKVFQNTILPTLPIEDNTVSVVCAFSVFTHIDTLETAWLAELRRILHKGGIAYVTIHGDHTWQTTTPSRPFYKDLMKVKSCIRDYDITPELFEKPMPAERVVLRWSTSMTTAANVFHSRDYLQNVWGRFFDVADIIQEGHEYQDVVVLRKT
jgi:SAM-dependent methyltransferase